MHFIQERKRVAMSTSYIVFVEYPIQPEEWPSFAQAWRASVDPNANVHLAHSRDQAGLVLEIWHFATESEADDFASIARANPLPGIDATKLKVWRFSAY
jgi:hypothetical protein